MVSFYDTYIECLVGYDLERIFVESEVNFSPQLESLVMPVREEVCSAPTNAPTADPTYFPTFIPSEQPTIYPTDQPSEQPMHQLPILHIFRHLSPQSNQRYILPISRLNNQCTNFRSYIFSDIYPLRATNDISY